MAAQCAVLIAGPTASGKSRLAMALAEAVGGVIVNADSMQVYHDLRVVTARPAESDEARIPHRLYGTIDGAERCSVGHWSRLVSEVLSESADRGRIPVVVGGTGLYFRALTEGLSEIPEIAKEIRNGTAALLAEMGPEAFHKRLSAVDPESARRIRISDPQRMSRAYEVFQATGRGLSAWQDTPGRPVLSGPTLKFVLETDREALYARCDQRFERMMEEGALEEVRTLAARGLDPDLPVMKAVGVPQLTEYLRVGGSLRDAVEGAKMMTRRYAKRQMTWFRHQMADWDRRDLSDIDSLVGEVAVRLAKLS